MRIRLDPFRPTAHAGTGCPPEASSRNPEQRRNLGFTHSIEVFGHSDLARHDPSRRGVLRASCATTFTGGFPALAITNVSPLNGAIDQLGEMSLGFVDVDGDHIGFIE